MMLLFGVVSYKVRPPRLVSYACLYTTLMKILEKKRFEKKKGIYFNNFVRTMDINSSLGAIKTRSYESRGKFWVKE